MKTLPQLRVIGLGICLLLVLNGCASSSRSSLVDSNKKVFKVALAEAPPVATGQARLWTYVVGEGFDHVTFNDDMLVWMVYKTYYPVTVKAGTCEVTAGKVAHYNPPMGAWRYNKGVYRKKFQLESGKQYFLRFELKYNPVGSINDVMVQDNFRLVDQAEAEREAGDFPTTINKLRYDFIPESPPE